MKILGKVQRRITVKPVSLFKKYFDKRVVQTKLETNILQIKKKTYLVF